MWQHVARLGCVVFVGGCSLIYNPSNIGNGTPSDGPKPDAAKQPDAEKILDGNDALLTITDVFPHTINEGQGDGSSRPQLLVLSGNFIGSDAVVTITAGSGSAMVSVDAGHVAIAADGDFIAVPVTSLVDGTLTGSDAPIPLTISVTQSSKIGPVTSVLADKLTLTPLDILTTMPTTVAPLYARIALGPTTWPTTQTTPIVLKATSTISVGDIAANGADAVKNVAGAGGPGGCAGGAAASPGGCNGGGASVSGGGGGGGGGFGTTGSGGGGTGGGAAGAPSGQPQVLTFDAANPEVDRASGGGGGNGTAGGGLGTAGTGGAGGGGGGSVFLSAGGLVQIAGISATGGAGGAGQAGGGVGPGFGGGGGGGAGGVVVLRSANDQITSTGVVVLTGGAGGALGGTGAGTGGAGGAGRFRWDAPTGSAPGNAHRGPTFAVSTAAAFTDEMPDLMVSGTQNDSFDVYVLDATGNPVTPTTGNQPANQTFGAGVLTIHPTLTRGYNLVCMSLHGGTRSDPLTDTCLEVAYLP